MFGIVIAAWEPIWNIVHVVLSQTRPEQVSGSGRDDGSVFLQDASTEAPPSLLVRDLSYRSQSDL